MLYIVGLGLADEKDITFRGLEIVKQCEQVFIEAYTYSLLVSLPTAFPRWNFNAQENLYGKPVTVTDRKTVEEKADQILTAAAASDVAFLVVGRSFWPRSSGLMWKVVPNALVTNAVGICGLQLNHYGEKVSIPFFTETQRPDSFYDKIRKIAGLDCILSAY
ncbi:unnamed protein product [Prunus armeniaca]|uniref:diphthine methyl ester synthase n=1 Tax=Prunus armeniaca TaxID=36596 RepID=A0A6J5WAI1_PRUAR|nr:unnamed protein product [Prunus armeniaca]